MRLWPHKPKLRIATFYACGHEQNDEALHLDGLGICRTCNAVRAVLRQDTGWL